MSFPAVNPIAANYADVNRIGGYVAARARAARLAGTQPIAPIGAVRPVGPSFDINRYAEVLSDATTYAADSRRSAWSNGDPRGEFPRSAPAGQALASLLAADPLGEPGPLAGSIRNVTPGLTTTGESEAAAEASASASGAAPGAAPGSAAASASSGWGSGRGIVIDPPAMSVYAAGARSYREVASLLA